MATIILRQTKGSPLTNAEVDANFTNLNTELGQKANAANAALTGVPTAPTATLDTSNTQLATTAFVQGLSNGYLSKSVAGGSTVALTAAETGNRVIKLTGALTANINVTIPNGSTGVWTIINATSGAFTATIKTVSGTGVVATQGKTSSLTSDGTDVSFANTALADVQLTGVPTAPTATGTTNTTQVATTAFVKLSASASAAKLTTARNISVSGQATGTVSFDGSANADIALTISQAGKDAVLGDSLALSIALG